MFVAHLCHEAIKIEKFPLALIAHSSQANSFMEQRDLSKIQTYLNRDLVEEFDLLEQYKTDLTYQYLQLKTLFITHKQQAVRSEAEMAEIQKLKEHPLLKDHKDLEKCVVYEIKRTNIG